MLIGSAVFAQLTTESRYTLRRAAPFLFYSCAIPVGYLDPQFNTWLLEPTRIRNPNGIWIGSAVFA